MDVKLGDTPTSPKVELAFGSRRGAMKHLKSMNSTVKVTATTI